MINEDINRPLEPIAGLALYGLLWPPFNTLVLAVLSVRGYDLKLGGALLWIILGALSLLVGTVFLAIFLFARRKPHPPLPGKTIALWVLILMLASSACLNLAWMQWDFFCRVGSCPDFN